MSYNEDMLRAIRHCARWQKGHIMTSVKTLRAALVDKFGTRQYRITQEGQIHVHGTMPNTNQVGWYLFGFVGDAHTEARLGL